MSTTNRFAAFTVSGLLLTWLWSPTPISAAETPDDAKAPNSYRLSKQVITGGGARMASRRYVLTGSVGQSVAGMRGQSQYVLTQGFHHPRDGDAAISADAKLATIGVSTVETKPKG